MGQPVRKIEQTRIAQAVATRIAAEVDANNTPAATAVRMDRRRPPAADAAEVASGFIERHLSHAEVASASQRQQLTRSLCGDGPWNRSGTGVDCAEGNSEGLPARAPDHRLAQAVARSGSATGGARGWWTLRRADGAGVSYAEPEIALARSGSAARAASTVTAGSGSCGSRGTPAGFRRAAVTVSGGASARSCDRSCWSLDAATAACAPAVPPCGEGPAVPTANIATAITSQASDRRDVGISSLTARYCTSRTGPCGAHERPWQTI